MSPTEHNPDQPTAVWHEVDGIIEHDNKLPNWWLMTLFGTIVFAIVYWLGYHTAGALPLISESYEREAEAHAARQAQLAAARPLDDALLTALATDQAALARGQQTFTSVCAACHGQKAEGLVGPNLTDSAWVHGGQPMQIYALVAQGSLQKGMPAWFGSLGDGGTRDVVAYLLSIKGTNVPGKAPEGTKE